MVLLGRLGSVLILDGCYYIALWYLPLGPAACIGDPACIRGNTVSTAAACEFPYFSSPFVIYLFIKHTHIDGRKQEWNRATRYTQYANCWPTQSMQLLSNICNKINLLKLTSLTAFV